MKYAIGIDIGGTKTACGLVDSKGVLRKKIIFKTGKKKRDIIKRLLETISLLMEGVKSDIKGIGVGVPGVIEEKDGRISRLPNLWALNGVKLKEIIQKKFNKKVVMMNDGVCTALGEYKFGVGRKTRSLFVVTLGTGIGGGMIINGEIYTGNGNAPEPGHMLLGKIEWEELASGKALERLLKKNKRKAFDIYSYNLGIGLSNIVKLYDPEIIVLTGGVIGSKEKFLNKAIAVAKKNTFFPIGKIVSSNFPEDVGVIGAASLIF